MPERAVPCRKCTKPIRGGSKTGLCRGCYDPPSKEAAVDPALSPTEQNEKHRETRRLQSEITRLRGLYDASIATVERLEREQRVATVLEQQLDTYQILPRTGGGTSEGVVVLVASDWHVEERVGAEVGGLNTYSLEIAQQRATTFFQAGLRLVQLLQKDIQIHTLVLPLLGDFISNDIHEEFADLAEAQPMHAIIEAQRMLISGIEFLLDHSDLNLTIPCHSGNHARTTKTTHFSAENGHSLEYLMYLHMAAYFRKESRVTFIIPEGIHSYMDILGVNVRFQHGHAIKYSGGVGGIYIPVNKAIGQWDKARKADLNVFGHFHQLRDGGNFICNGSLIGYNGFAMSIKADFEKPKQALFLIDRKRGRTCTWPVLV